MDSSESWGAAEPKFLGSVAERSGHSSSTQAKLNVETLPQAQPAKNIRPQLPLFQLAHGADCSMPGESSHLPSSWPLKQGVSRREASFLRFCSEGETVYRIREHLSSQCPKGTDFYLKQCENIQDKEHPQKQWRFHCWATQRRPRVWLERHAKLWAARLARKKKSGKETTMENTSKVKTDLKDLPQKQPLQSGLI